MKESTDYLNGKITGSQRLNKALFATIIRNVPDSEINSVKLEVANEVREVVSIELARFPSGYFRKGVRDSLSEFCDQILA